MAANFQFSANEIFAGNHAVGAGEEKSQIEKGDSKPTRLRRLSLRSQSRDRNLHTVQKKAISKPAKKLKDKFNLKPAEIKRLYTNKKLTNFRPSNLETIFEGEDDDDNEEEENDKTLTNNLPTSSSNLSLPRVSREPILGKRKIKRSIIFTDGAINKQLARKRRLKARKLVGKKHSIKKIPMKTFIEHLKKYNEDNDGGDGLFLNLHEICVPKPNSKKIKTGLFSKKSLEEDSENSSSSSADTESSTEGDLHQENISSELGDCVSNDDFKGESDDDDFSKNSLSKLDNTEDQMVTSDNSEDEAQQCLTVDSISATGVYDKQDLGTSEAFHTVESVENFVSKTLDDIISYSLSKCATETMATNEVSSTNSLTNKYGTQSDISQGDEDNLKESKSDINMAFAHNDESIDSSTVIEDSLEKSLKTTVEVELAIGENLKIADGLAKEDPTPMNVSDIAEVPQDAKDSTNNNLVLEEKLVIQPTLPFKEEFQITAATAGQLANI